MICCNFAAIKKRRSKVNKGCYVIVSANTTTGNIQGKAADECVRTLFFHVRTLGVPLLP